MMKVVTIMRRLKSGAGYSLVESMAALAILLVVLAPTVALLGEVAFRPGLGERTAALEEAGLEMEAALGEDSLAAGESERRAGRLLIQRSVEEEGAELMRITIRVSRTRAKDPLIELTTETLK